MANTTDVSEIVSRASMHGLVYQEVPGDGHCLFHAVAIYACETQEILREKVAKHLEENLEEYREVIAGMEAASGRSMEAYINAVRNGTEWADNIEIAILMKILNRPIMIMGPNGEIQNSGDAASYPGDPIFVYDNGHNHYDGLLLTDEYRERSEDVLTNLMQFKELNKSIQLGTLFQRREIPGDGNQFYEAAALSLSGKTASDLRQCVADYLATATGELQQTLTRLANHRHRYHATAIDAYLQDIKNGAVWSGDMEIVALQQALQRPIVLLSAKNQVRNRKQVESQNGEPVFIYDDGLSRFDGAVRGTHTHQMGAAILNALLAQPEQKASVLPDISNAITQTSRGMLIYQELFKDNNQLYHAICSYVGMESSTLRQAVAETLRVSIDNYRITLDLLLSEYRCSEEIFIQRIEEGTIAASALDLVLLARHLQQPIVLIDQEGRVKNESDVALYIGEGFAEPIFVVQSGPNCYAAAHLNKNHATSARDVLALLPRAPRSRSASLKLSASREDLNLIISPNSRITSDVVNLLADSGLQYLSLAAPSNTLFDAVALQITERTTADQLRELALREISAHLPNYIAIIERSANSTPANYLNDLRANLSAPWPAELMQHAIENGLNRPIVMLNTDGNILNVSQTATFLQQPLFVLRHDDGSFDSFTWEPSITAKDIWRVLRGPGSLRTPPEFYVEQENLGYSYQPWDLRLFIEAGAQQRVGGIYLNQPVRAQYLLANQRHPQRFPRFSVGDMDYLFGATTMQTSLRVLLPQIPHSKEQHVFVIPPVLIPSYPIDPNQSVISKTLAYYFDKAAHPFYRSAGEFVLDTDYNPTDVLKLLRYYLAQKADCLLMPVVRYPEVTNATLEQQAQEQFKHLVDERLNEAFRQYQQQPAPLWLIPLQKGNKMAFLEIKYTLPNKETHTQATFEVHYFQPNGIQFLNIPNWRLQLLGERRVDLRTAIGDALFVKQGLWLVEAARHFARGENIPAAIDVQIEKEHLDLLRHLNSDNPHSCDVFDELYPLIKAHPEIGNRILFLCVTHNPNVVASKQTMEQLASQNILTEQTWLWELGLQIHAGTLCIRITAYDAIGNSVKQSHAQTWVDEWKKLLRERILRAKEDDASSKELFQHITIDYVWHAGKFDDPTIPRNSSYERVFAVENLWQRVHGKPILSPYQVTNAPVSPTTTPSSSGRRRAPSPSELTPAQSYKDHLISAKQKTAALMKKHREEVSQYCLTLRKQHKDDSFFTGLLHRLALVDSEQESVAGERAQAAFQAFLMRTSLTSHQYACRLVEKAVLEGNIDLLAALISQHKTQIDEKTLLMARFHVAQVIDEATENFLKTVQTMLTAFIERAIFLPEDLEKLLAGLKDIMTVQEPLIYRENNWSEYVNIWLPESGIVPNTPENTAALSHYICLQWRTRCEAMLFRVDDIMDSRTEVVVARTRVKTYQQSIVHQRSDIELAIEVREETHARLALEVAELLSDEIKHQVKRSCIAYQLLNAGMLPRFAVDTVVEGVAVGAFDYRQLSLDIFHNLWSSLSVSLTDTGPNQRAWFELALHHGQPLVAQVLLQWGYNPMGYAGTTERRASAQALMKQALSQAHIPGYLDIALSLLNSDSDECWTETPEEMVTRFSHGMLCYHPIFEKGLCFYEAIAKYLGTSVHFLRAQVAMHIEEDSEHYRTTLLRTQEASTPEEQDRFISIYLEGIRSGDKRTDKLEIHTLMAVLQRPIIAIRSNGLLENFDTENRYVNHQPIFVFSQNRSYAGLTESETFDGASIKEHLEQARTLTQASQSWFATTDLNGDTLWHHVARTQHAARNFALRILVKLSLEPWYQKNRRGETPLSLALRVISRSQLTLEMQDEKVREFMRLILSALPQKIDNARSRQFVDHMMTIISAETERLVVHKNPSMIQKIANWLRNRDPKQEALKQRQFLDYTYNLLGIGGAFGDDYSGYLALALVDTTRYFRKDFARQVQEQRALAASQPGYALMVRERVLNQDSMGQIPFFGRREERAQATIPVSTDRRLMPTATPDEADVLEATADEVVAFEATARQQAICVRSGNGLKYQAITTPGLALYDAVAFLLNQEVEQLRQTVIETMSREAADFQVLCEDFAATPRDYLSDLEQGNDQSHGLLSLAILMKVLQRPIFMIDSRYDIKPFRHTKLYSSSCENALFVFCSSTNMGAQHFDALVLTGEVAASTIIDDWAARAGMAANPVLQPQFERRLDEERREREAAAVVASSPPNRWSIFRH